MATDTRLCPACGLALRPGRRICAGCGHALPMVRAAAAPPRTIEVDGATHFVADGWDRVLAAGIDVGLAIAFVFVVYTAMLLYVGFTLPTAATDIEYWDQFFAALDFTARATLLAAFAFVWAGESVGWSPGKSVAGIRVVRTDGRFPGVFHGLTRGVVKILGSAFLFGGFAMAIGRPDLRAWHDEVASTIVVKQWANRPSLRRGIPPVPDPPTLAWRATLLSAGCALLAIALVLLMPPYWELWFYWVY